MRNALKKRLIWVLASIIGIPVLLYGLATAYFVFVPSADDYAHRTAFDPAGWRDRRLDADPLWPTRLRMVDDLLAKKRLDGLTRREVESLLGSGDRTDKWKEWHLVYHLGPERRGLFRIDSEWLVIRFGAFRTCRGISGRGRLKCGSVALEFSDCGDIAIKDG